MVVMSDFECTDLDNNPLSYSLTQFPNDGVFEIDAANKQIKLKGKFNCKQVYDKSTIKQIRSYIVRNIFVAPLDYETTPFYSIVIRVSDGSLSTKMTLAVNVIDENESEPQFKDKGTCIMIISTVVFFCHGFYTFSMAIIFWMGCFTSGEEYD